MNYWTFIQNVDYFILNDVEKKYERQNFILQQKKQVKS